ncbi:MAG: hypothetical protein AMXMBFR33_47100 [Candidatus Xenobia bacterium]
MLLAGCSGGTRPDGTPAPPPGPSGTASLTLKVDVRPLAASRRGIPTTLIIRVVDAQEIERDVIAPVSIPLGNDPLVLHTMTGIPLGMRVVRLQVLDDEQSLLGGAISAPLMIVAGPNTPLTLQVQFAPLLRFRTEPGNTLANQPFAPPVQVELLDPSGQLLTTTRDAVTLNLANNPGGASLSGTLTVQASNGVATFPGVALDQPGTGYQLQASAAGFGSARSQSFDVAATVGPPARLVFFTQPPAALAGQALAPPIQVVVQDAAGVTVPSASDPVVVSLGSNPGATVLNGTLSVQPVNGAATFSDLHLNVPGTGYTLVASSAALPAVTSSPFNITTVASQLVFGTQPSNGQAREIMTPLTVEVQDVFGNVVPGASDTITLTLNSPAPPTLSGTTTVNAVNGVASFNDLVVSMSGAGYTLQATAPGLTTALSAPFDQSFPRGYLLPIAGLPLGGLTSPARGAMSQNGDFLYIGEFNTPGRVVGYSVNAVSGALAVLGTSPFGTLGDLVGGVAVTPDDSQVVVTNAATGNVVHLALDNTTGALSGGTAAITDPQPLGVVVRPGTPQYAYVMSNFSASVTGFDLTTMLTVPGSGFITAPGITQTAVLHPNNNFLFVTSGDVLAINPVNGGISPVLGSPFATASGRSQALDPTGSFLYTTQVNQIAVHSVNPASGALNPIPGSPFPVPGDLTSARIVLNGEFLYTYVVGSSDILIFALDPVTGVPTAIDDSPVTAGNVAFELITDPLGRFLYAADNAAGQVFGFSIVP